MEEILVVDDESIIRENLERILKEEKYNVTSVDTGTSALDFLKQTGADVVLLDLDLPDLPGLEVLKKAKELGAPFELVVEVHNTGKLPVVNFAAGGMATPADAALMMQLGAEGVFVGSGIFKSSNPEVRAKAIVRATTHYQDPVIIAEVSKDLGEAMPGLDINQIPSDELLAKRGW